MLIVMRIFFGLLAIGAGTLMLKYNYQLVGLVGRQDWIESKLGMGSTYLFYKVIGILVVIGGILYITGFDDDALRILFSPLRGLFPQG